MTVGRVGKAILIVQFREISENRGSIQMSEVVYSATIGKREKQCGDITLDIKITAVAPNVNKDVVDNVYGIFVGAGRF